MDALLRAKSPRVRGFAPWKPQSATMALLEQVRRVLDEYADYLPLTIRQIFYRLVGAYDYPKTENAYERLSEHLNRARRAHMIEMSAIRDDGGTILRPQFWGSKQHFLDSIREEAQHFRLDRTAGQPTRLVVICEAGGMVPQLGMVAEPFGITVWSSGGFDSVTEKHAFAEEVAADADRPTEVLHIGDHDPSGTSMFLAFLEDAEAFSREFGGEAIFTRLAVTPAQIAQYDLPTAPPRETDRRAFRGETCQAEALAPDVLNAILRDAIEARLDRGAYDAVLRRERKTRRELVKLIGGAAERNFSSKQGVNEP
jgi:hypothetical protein